MFPLDVFIYVRLEILSTISNSFCHHNTYEYMCTNPKYLSFFKIYLIGTQSSGTIDVIWCGYLNMFHFFVFHSMWGNRFGFILHDFGHIMMELDSIWFMCVGLFILERESDEKWILLPPLFLFPRNSSIPKNGDLVIYYYVIPEMNG